MLLALFIVEHCHKPHLLLRKINLASSSSLILQKGIELLKVILKPVLILEDTLVLIPIALFKCWSLTCIDNIVVQLIEVYSLSDVHS